MYSAESMRNISKQNIKQSEKIENASNFLIDEINKASLSAAELGLFSTRYDLADMAHKYNLNLNALEKVAERALQYLKRQGFDCYLDYNYSPDECVIFWGWEEQ